MSAPRIIAGSLRGRRIEVPRDSAVRPTSERMREALFDRLAHGDPPLDGAHFLDLFAGTGAVGIEALSRGAALTTFVESDHATVRALRRTLARLDLERHARVLNQDGRFLPTASQPADLAFLDPPYGRALLPAALTGLLAQRWLREDATIVCELARREPFTAPKGFDVEDERPYGAGRLIFLRPLTVS